MTELTTQLNPTGSLPCLWLPPVDVAARWGWMRPGSAGGAFGSQLAIENALLSAIFSLILMLASWNGPVCDTDLRATVALGVHVFLIFDHLWGYSLKERHCGTLVEPFSCLRDIPLGKGLWVKALQATEMSNVTCFMTLPSIS